MRISIAPTDLVLEGIALLGMIALVVLPALYVDQLPERIPAHFDARGTVDGKADKVVLWWVAGIGLGVYLVLQATRLILERTIRATEEESDLTLTIVRSGIRSFNAISACMWVYIMVTMIRSALGQGVGLGTYFFPVVFVSLFGVIGYIAWRVKKFESLKV